MNNQNRRMFIHSQTPLLKDATEGALNEDCNIIFIIEIFLIF